MAKSVITNQKELVNKLSKIIKAYDIYVEYIDDYRKYSNAVEYNRELDQQFIRTCKEYGYDVQKSFCYVLAESFVSGRFDSAEDVVIDYINSLETEKEETTMKNNTNTTGTNNSVTTTEKEKITMESLINDIELCNEEETARIMAGIDNTSFIESNSSSELETTMFGSEEVSTVTITETKKEETTMKTREFTLEELVQVLTDNQKVQDAEYIKKDDLRVILNQQFELGFNNRATRTEMIDTVMAMYKDSLDIADEIAYGNIIVEENNASDSVSVGDLDITHDNAPESIEEEAEVKLTDELATKILEKMIRQADTNRAHNFISDWMLTSIISELVIGHPLKDKGHEYYKSFTDEQKKILVDIRKAFIDKVGLITKTNNGKVTGYYIPAKILVWGRHIYLGVACVYRYVNNNKILAEYHVSLNGIKNTATGNITALDDAAYETLDTKCVFVM